MAVFTRIRKLANPQRRRRKPVRVATRKKALRRVKAKRVTRKAVKRRNPALLVTLGAVNPQKKRKVKVAKKRKRNPVTRSRRSRNAATRVIVVAPKRKRRNSAVRRRRSNPRRRISVRRRNPSVFGSRLGSGQTLSMIAGGLLGVTAAKMIPGMLPASLVASPIMKLIATGASAWVASLLAGKVFSGPFSDAVFFGGLMQTGSVGINIFIPSLSTFGLSGVRGMGDLVPGQFSVPQNPLMIPAPPPPVVNGATRINLNGINRAWGKTF